MCVCVPILLVATADHNRLDLSPPCTVPHLCRVWQHSVPNPGVPSLRALRSLPGEAALAVSGVRGRREGGGDHSAVRVPLLGGRAGSHEHQT